MSRRAAAACLIVGFAACGDGDGGGPVPFEVDDTRPAPVEVPRPTPNAKRTVMQRNPFGNVAVTDNLLWDGDFEFRPSFPDQYGWLVGTGVAVGFGLPTLAIGARCRSGVKCAELAPGDKILGIAVAEEGQDLLVSFWAFPEAGNCAAISASLTAQLQSLRASEVVEPVAELPEEDGWCRYELLSPSRPGAPYLSIENISALPVVIDDAVVRAAPADMQRTKSLPQRVSAAQEERLTKLRESARRARLPRRTPPGRGQQELAKALRRAMR